MKTALFLLAPLLLLPACSSAPVKTARLEAKLSLLYMNARRLEILPCGCGIAPEGGIAREMNVVEGFRGSRTGSILYFAGGGSFLPDATSAPSELTKKKDDALVRAWNEIGLTALAPTADDTRAGLPFLRDLEKRSRFRFVSSNLVTKESGTPLFERMLRFDFGRMPVFVLGLSPAGVSDPAVEVRPWRDTLTAIGNELPAGPKLVVAIAPLAKADRERLFVEFPWVNIVLGGEATESTYAVEQRSATVLYLNPAGQGRWIGAVELDLKESFTGFFHPGTAAVYKESRAYWEKESRKLDRKLAVKGLAEPKRRELAGEKAKLETLMVEGGSVPLRPSADTITYRYSNTVLDETYDFPPNRAGEIAAPFKEDAAK